MTTFPELIRNSDHWAIGFVYECPTNIWRGYSYITMIGEGFDSRDKAIEFIFSEETRGN